MGGTVDFESFWWLDSFDSVLQVRRLCILLSILHAYVALAVFRVRFDAARARPVLEIVTYRDIEPEAKVCFPALSPETFGVFANL